MTNNPFFLLVMTAGTLYVGKLWWDDLKAAQAGAPNPKAIPGATPAKPRAIAIAVLGAWVLLALETWGEHALDIAGEQSRITWLFALYTLVAPILEEMIFRGFLVIQNRGKAVLWFGAVVASLVFAALHPFLWSWDDRGFLIAPSLKGAFSTTVVFAFSLWLYAARFANWNPSRSLLPCFVAHAAKNAGVIAIKFSQGFIGGAW